MRWLTAVVCCALVLGTLADTDDREAFDVEYLEQFDSGWEGRWLHTTDPEYQGKFKAASLGEHQSHVLKVPEKARKYGLSTKLADEIDPADGLVLQYELKLDDGLSCGGAYLKFLTSADDFEPKTLHSQSPYSVMFGPDKCGSTNKVHLILRHKSPSGEIEEKHLASPPSVKLDKNTHVYTAVLRPDNTYSILIDGKEEKKGSLMKDFEPSINPPKEIPDPDDEKPDDWEDEPKIPDPDASKPDDWDEDAPEEIPDPDAEKPEDWDDEEDGEWTAPMIKNPDYKGKWSAPLIDNPAYKGEWKPRNIPNPDYFDDKQPLSNIGKIGGIAVEIWTMDSDMYFDNILISASSEKAATARKLFWKPVEKAEQEAAKVEAAKRKPEASGLAQYISSLFDEGPLAPYRSLVAPVLDLMERSPGVPYIVIGVLGGAFTLLFAVCCLGTNKKGALTAAAARAKKDDTAQPDDDDDEEEEEKEAAAAIPPAAKAQKTTAADTAAEKAAAAAVDAAAAEDEEEDAPAASSTKQRRSRRRE